MTPDTGLSSGAEMIGVLPRMARNAESHQVIFGVVHPVAVDVMDVQPSALSWRLGTAVLACPFIAFSNACRYLHPIMRVRKQRRSSIPGRILNSALRVVTGRIVVPAPLAFVPGDRSRAAAFTRGRILIGNHAPSRTCNFPVGPSLLRGPRLDSAFLEQRLNREVPDTELARESRNADPGSIFKSRRVQPHNLVSLFVRKLPVVVSLGHVS
jgi:hypothetical protein